MPNPTMRQHAIIIVGAGAVGSALALDLLQQGRVVVVLEARQPDYTVRPPEREIALSAGSVGYLQRLGIWSAIAETGVGEIRHIRVLEPGGAGTVALDSDATGQGTSLGAVVEMGQLLQPMHQALQAQGAWLAPVDLRKMERDADGVRLDCVVDGQAQRLCGQLLVAADGTNSAMRRMAAISTWGWDHNRFGLVASLVADHHQHSAYECFHREGPLALLPIGDGRFSMVWAVTPQRASRLLSLGDDVFIAELEAALDPVVRQQLGAIRATSPRGAFALELRIARSFISTRMALVGNAAHTMHPVAGQGMNLGLRDVMALARVLGENPVAAEDAGDSIVLEQYADARRLDVAMTAGFTEGVLASFAVGGVLPSLTRQAGLRLMQRYGGLRGLLTDYASGRAQGV
ncbi:MAG: FAD-dependent monooxygenase [Mariprofundales bacterium]|nr:FAD-dependent monooxygenase [Mariprofundales bacterium]